MLKGVIKIAIVIAILLLGAACGSSGVDNGISSQSVGADQGGQDIGRPGDNKGPISR